MGSSAPLTPTYQGHIASTQDALLLFEACLEGALNHVARRPHDRERASLIQSGNVFIYEEHSSGIKRWTDGVSWSPSRILGNFLIYRELEHPFCPGEKKRAIKKPRRPSGGVGKFQGSCGRLGNGYGAIPTSETNGGSSSSIQGKEKERDLIGSLIDSYGFKKDGLVKKTISVNVGGISHHLVSYYNVSDVVEKQLTTPFTEPTLQCLQPRQDLVNKQNFRTPIEQVDSMEDSDDQSLGTTYPVSNSYDISNRFTPQLRPIPQLLSMANNCWPYDDSLPTTSASNSYNAPFVPVTTARVFPPNLPPENDTYKEYQYTATSTLRMDPTTRIIPSELPRRASAYDSIDFGISCISASSSDSKLNSCPGYSSQFYEEDEFPRGTPHRRSGHYPNPKPFPTLITRNQYVRAQANTYTTMDTVSTTATLWQIGHILDDTSTGTVTTFHDAIGEQAPMRRLYA